MVLLAGGANGSPRKQEHEERPVQAVAAMLAAQASTGAALRRTQTGKQPLLCGVSNYSSLYKLFTQP